MAFFVEIHDGPLAFDLIDLLRIIEPEGGRLNWAIFELEALGQPKCGNLLDLEKAANESESGLPMSWQELKELAENLLQVIWGLFVAVRPGQPFPSKQPLSQLLPHTELLLRAFDSSHWAIYAREDFFLKRLKGKFRDIRSPGFND